MLHILDNFLDKFEFKSDFLFRNLDPSQVLKIENAFEPLYFKKGDKLFYEDGVPTGVFYINEGLAKKYNSLMGRPQIFYIYKKGDLLGYHALLSNERYQDSCEALIDLNVSFLSKKNFNSLLDTIDGLRDSIMKNMAHEFGVMANMISVLAQKSQKKRLAIQLLILAHKFQKEDQTDLVVEMNREDLANLIGTSRESVSRSLKELKEIKLIELTAKAIRISSPESILRFIHE
jgi:CRP-like cAMP-binding protein